MDELYSFIEKCKKEPENVRKNYKSSDISTNEYHAAQRNLIITILNDNVPSLSSIELEDIQEPKEPSIDQLKRQIKHCKNPIELKNLNRQLNEVYKERKIRKKYETKV